MFTGYLAAEIPDFADVFIPPVFVVIPSGQHELAAGLTQGFAQFFFTCFVPSIIVIIMAANIRRVAIDERINFGHCYSFLEGLADKFPVINH